MGTGIWGPQSATLFSCREQPALTPEENIHTGHFDHRDESRRDWSYTGMLKEHEVTTVISTQ